MVIDGDGPLPGGRSNPGSVFRQGQALVRPVGDGRWVELLRRINQVFDAAPEVIGSDGGTVSLEWVDGDAPQLLGDAPLADPGTVAAVGRLLRRLHDVTAPIAVQVVPARSVGLADPSGAAEVVCHGDPVPGNIVFRDGRPVALIDWEHAAPGRRAWDLAVALRWWSPLRAPQNLRADETTLDAAARARSLLAGYGADAALSREAVLLLAESQEVAAANARRLMHQRGDDAYRRWAAGGGERRLDDDKAWLTAQSQVVLATVTKQ